MTTNQYLSFVALLAEQDSRLIKKRRMLLELLWEYGPMTLDIMERKTGWLRSTASGRLSELLDSGYVREDAPGTFSVVTSDSEIRHLKTERAEERYERWLREGLRLGYFDKQSGGDAL